MNNKMKENHKAGINGRILLHKLPVLLFLCVILYLIALNYKKEESGNELLKEKAAAIPAEMVEQYFPGYTALYKKSEGVYEVERTEGGGGYLIETTPFTKDIIGFAGPVPILMAITDEDRVLGIQLMENEESPGFVEEIAEAGFFNSWDNKTVGEATTLEVEAVSGASMTSGAVKSNVKKALELYRQQESEAEKTDYLRLGKNIAGFLVLLLAFISMFPVKGLKKYRWALLLASVLILGFWSGYFLSFALLFGWLINGLPWSGRILLLVMAALAFIIPLFWGKAYYCAYVCPFGAAQELAGKIRKKKIVPAGKVRVVLKYLRFFYFIGVLLVLLWGLKVDVTQFEPLSAFMFQAAGKWVLAFAVVILILSLFLSRPWCNYLCLTGQFLEILRRGTAFPARKQVITEWILVGISVVLIAFILW